MQIIPNSVIGIILVLAVFFGVSGALVMVVRLVLVAPWCWWCALVLLVRFDQDAVAFVYYLEVTGALQSKQQYVEIVIGHYAIEFFFF